MSTAALTGTGHHYAAGYRCRLAHCWSVHLVGRARSHHPHAFTMACFWPPRRAPKCVYTLSRPKKSAKHACSDSKTLWEVPRIQVLYHFLRAMTTKR
eukprot:8590494-Alexandrium_andersonii.AAC.1